MKKWLACMAAALMLCGCGAEKTLAETVADEWTVPVLAQPREIRVELPGEASVCTMEGENGRLYICDGYEIALQTRPSGDLNDTVQTMTGFSEDDLTVMQTESEGIRRYEFAWASAGERGERVGRGAVLDDGDYHYCLSVLQDVEGMDTCQIIWSQVFHSFGLA